MGDRPLSTTQRLTLEVLDRCGEPVPAAEVGAAVDQLDTTRAEARSRLVSSSQAARLGKTLRLLAQRGYVRAHGTAKKGERTWSITLAGSAWLSLNQGGSAS